MKKGWILLFVIVLFFSLLINDVLAGNLESDLESDLESSLESSLESKNKKEYVIRFKDETIKSDSRLSSKELLVKETISKFENELNVEFKRKFLQDSIATANLNKEQVKYLQNDPRVESIIENFVFKAQLSESVDVINASSVWNLNYNGKNITGSDQTICVLDSGIDYNHENLGNCTITSTILEGTIESYLLESVHPYENNRVYNYTITKPGYDSIAVHFENLRLESRYDQIEVFDGNKKLVATYTGTKNNVWTPSVEGDTIYINLTTDVSVTDWGFKINATINGTTNTSYNWENCSGLVGGIDIVNSDLDPMDDNGHGTHVSGIIKSVNPTYKGVAYDSNILSVKVLDSAGNGYFLEIYLGIKWCLDHSQEYNISVISMSIGDDGNYTENCDGVSEYALLKELVDFAVERNISVIAASGNNKTGLGSGGIAGPACLENVVSVGALTKTDLQTSYSQVGNLLDFFAPGTGIVSTVLGGGTASKSGTSMATPHVSAAYALIQQYAKVTKGRLLTPLEVYQSLNSTGKQVDDEGFIKSRIDIYSAIKSFNQPPEIVNFHPSSFDVNIVEPNNQSFNITFNDSDDFEWNVSWLVDSVLVFSEISNFTFSTFNFSGDYTSAGVYNISVIVADYFNSSFQSWNLTVNNTNRPPLLNVSLLPQNAKVNNNLTCNYSFTDLDGEVVSVSSIKWFVNGVENSTFENESLINSSFTFWDQNWSCVVNVTDGLDFVVVEDWIIISNIIPNITSFHPSSFDVNIVEPNNQSFNITFNDSDDFEWNVSWLVDSVLVFSEISNFTFSTFNFSGDYTSAGVYNISVIVADYFNSSFQSWNLTVNNTNRPPEYTIIPDLNWTVNTTKTINLTEYFEDPDNDSMIFNFTGNLVNITILISQTTGLAILNSSISIVEFVNFTADDGEYTIISNQIKLNVTLPEQSQDDSEDSDSDDSSTTSSSPSISTSLSPILQEEPQTEDDETLEVEEESNIKIEKTKNLSLEPKIPVMIEIEDMKINSIIIIPSDGGTRTIMVRELKRKPESTKEVPTMKKAYSYFEISFEDEVEKANISFKIEKSWLEDNNIDKNKVYLARYVDDWIGLDTRLLNETNNELFYVSETPGFSYFTIWGEELDENFVPEVIVDDISDPTIIIEEEDSDKNGKEIERLKTIARYLVIFTTLGLVMIFGLLIVGKILKH